jgi:F420-dependent oxidoreductase-like protein
MTSTAHPLRIGFKISLEAAPLPTLRAAWRLADEAGFDHLWGYDHFMALGPDPAAEVFEAWTVLAAMAEITTRIRLGILVTGNLFRHPAVLAKTAVTVDHLSGGRLEMGFGAGAHDPEFKALGLRFPPRAEQMDRFEEACEVLKLLWQRPRTTFDGAYYSLHDAIAEPKPVQQPYPPLWLGGTGPKRTLAIVARHADVWNTSVSDLARDIESSRILDRHCEAIGRDPRTIRRSLQLFWTGLDDTRRKAEDYLGAGFTDILLTLNAGRFPSHADLPRLSEQVAAALPRFRELGPVA